MFIPGEGVSHGSTLYSGTGASRYLQQGCSGSLAYVTDTCEGRGHDGYE